MFPASKGPQSKNGPVRSPPPKPMGSPVKSKGKAKITGRKKDDIGQEGGTLARRRFVKAANSIRAFIRFQKALSGNKSVEFKRGKSATAQVRLENTYRTEPQEHLKFKPDPCRAVVKDILHDRLERYTYDNSSAPKIARALTATITDRLKAETKKTAPRYKVICNVIIGQLNGQGVNVCSRSVWNDHTDNYLSINYSNNEFFAVAMVHAVYMD